MPVSIFVAVLCSFALAAVAFFIQWFRAKIRIVQLENELKLFQFRIADREKNEGELKAAAQVEFASLATRLIERESLQFRESSEKGIEKLMLPLLTPLKDRLRDFEKRVEESYHSEGRERFVLKTEIERLVVLNERMAKETNSLTLALRGDSKFQGDWGEMILESVLEASGLRAGIEFQVQPSLTDSAGDRYRPDFVVRLPDDKQILIDSKVSLTAYELYCRLEEGGQDPTLKERHIKAHIESINRHVNDLAEKHYPKLKGLKTPEFVFLFTPIEPAYLLAMRHDPDLAVRAWKKGVAIVTATTLFTSLKTVASIWRLENQNRNAQEIADEAAKLYDKFVGFNDDFERLGQLLEGGVAQFDEVRRKLRQGPGNVFRKIEALRELGAAPNKRIRPDLLE